MHIMGLYLFVFMYMLPHFTPESTQRISVKFSTEGLD